MVFSRFLKKFWCKTSNSGCLRVSRRLCSSSRDGGSSQRPCPTSCTAQLPCFNTGQKIWANPGLFFVYFRPFLISTTVQYQFQQFILKKHRWCAWDIRTWGRRMVGADETTELPPNFITGLAPPENTHRWVKYSYTTD